MKHCASVRTQQPTGHPSLKHKANHLDELVASMVAGRKQQRRHQLEQGTGDGAIEAMVPTMKSGVVLTTSKMRVLFQSLGPF